MAISIDHHNFCFPVPEKLENDRVLLVPFIPSKHAEPFMAQAMHVPDLLVHMPLGPFKDAQHFVTESVQKCLKDPGCLLFAIYDKSTSTSSDSDSTALAGIIAFKESSVAHLKTEIGTVVVLPKFQRTNVGSNAVGLLLHHALDLPSNNTTPENTTTTTTNDTSGLGLRRVSWMANVHNEASIRFADRLGFTREGVLRWDRVFPEDRKDKPGVGNGLAVREGDPRVGCVGRDSVLFSFCWDDWESGGRERVDAIMAWRK